MNVEEKNAFMMKMLSDEITDHISLINGLDHSLRLEILKIVEAIRTTFLNGGKLLICGNGGSAADSQHIAAEFVGRFRNERRALPAIALTTDTSALTAIGNDYSYNDVFSRQVDALALDGDVLLAISTSGNSLNVLKAVESALSRNCMVIGLTGGNGGKLCKKCEYVIKVPSDNTARIQEAHILIGHLICCLIDTVNWD
jgi:D-sedoheptulose 7-phosphate isomerase